jgi:hypothetical protein
MHALNPAADRAIAYLSLLFETEQQAKVRPMTLPEWTSPVPHLC